MNKPLGEEQADMRTRWSDPAYRWANDSELRRRYSKEFREKYEENTERQSKVSESVPNAGSEATKGTRPESEER